ncbi:proton-conducting transporter membrane subunit [Campylobacter sp. MG1]|uniref:proton-conducting transporter transmembrane domain-containing protein n=1 Tax=Campylobacter sp. MG1 TaxID=2976332 RepID=UPI00226D0E1B|nr:proton-conducting transporter membrane subunit [Campylobacter sp. MG1]
MGCILCLYLLLGIFCLLSYKFQNIAKFIGFGGAFLLGLVSCLFFVLGLYNQHIFVLPTNLLFETNFEANNLENFFLTIVSLITSFGSIYSLDYLKNKNVNLAVFASLYNFFILSMFLVILSNNVFSFILLWEVMTILSALFLYFNDNSKDILKAVLVYIGVAQFGAFLMVIALLIMSSSAESIYFSDFKNINLTQSLNYICFLLLVLGFGSKAGIFPLHAWLPFAYNIAPYNSVALMSAVMGKVAIFGIIKFTLYLNISASMAYTIIILGMISAVLGILYGVIENNYKKAIGYSSIENIGIILIAIGVGLYGLAIQNTTISIMGFLAALFHSLNHSVFKSLLFFAAGAVNSTVGTSDINKLGGLHKKMPLISYAFLIGAMAISVIPPLSGFMSEWVLFKGIIISASKGDVIARLMMVLALLSIGVAGSLAIMTFVKLYGGIFLGEQRNEEIHSKAKEGGIFTIIPLYVLAILSICFGIFSGFVINKIIILCSSIINVEYSEEYLVSMPIVTIILIAILLLVFIALMFAKINKNPVRYTKPWATGFKYSPKMQISSTPFTGDLRRILSFFYRHETKFSDDGYFTKSKYEIIVKEIFWDKIYVPLINLNLKIANKLSPIQNGYTNIYALYIVVYLCLMFVVSYYLL